MRSLHVTEPRAEIDLLLAQTGWLRRLSRQLVADPDLADDAVQDTLTAALRAPPRGAASAPVLRAWLRSVLHGQVRSTRRSRQRRSERERRAARAEIDKHAAADLIVGRAESARVLVEEVHALPEPHQSTLLLFYFEGLSTAEIALQLALAEGTVRTRLWRARDALRERLDRRHRGNRDAWVNALIPIGGLTGPLPVSAAVSLPTPGLLTLTAMAKFALLAATLVASTLLLMRLPDAAPDADVLPLEGRSTAADVAAVSEPAPRESERAARVAPSEPANMGAAPYEAIGPDGLFRPLLRGRVTDTAGRPIPGAHVIGTWGQWLGDGGPSKETVSDADGRYALVMPERALLSPHSFDGIDLAGRFATLELDATCTAEGHNSTIVSVPFPTDEPATFEQSFELTPDSELDGVRILVQGPDGKPAGRVCVALFDPGTGRVYEDEERRKVCAMTGADGRAQSDWRPPVATIPFAMSVDGLFGRGELFAPEEGGIAEIVIRTTADVDLSGVVVDAGGRPVPTEMFRIVRSEEQPDESEWELVDIRQSLSSALYSAERPWAGFGGSRRYVETDLDGHFHVGHLAAGTYWARLSDDSVHGPFALGSEVVLGLQTMHSVFVRAVDHRGRAVKGASLVASNRSGSRIGGIPSRLQYVHMQLTEGRGRLTAQHGDAAWAWRDIEVPRDTAAPIDLVLDFSTPPLAVTFRVLDAEGAPTPASVHTVRLAPPEASDWMVRRDHERDHRAQDGVCRAELRAGSYVVRIDPDDEWHLPTRRRVRVTDEGEDHALALARGGRVRLVWVGTRAADPAMAMRPVLHVRRAGSEGRWITTSQSGGAYSDELTLAIEGSKSPIDPRRGPEQDGPLLPPDMWDIRVECKGFATTERTVTVEAGATVKIDVRFD